MHSMFVTQAPPVATCSLQVPLSQNADLQASSPVHAVPSGSFAAQTP